jgi:hypothetical protein
MADAIHPNFTRRLRFTPMRDLLRLNISGRLDWKSKIASAELPQPARDLIYRVIRRSRLWKWERANVTDELIAHFTDGLRASESIEQIIRKFGDERLAAKLIRRAAWRKRNILIRTLAATFRTLALVVAVTLVLYGILALIFISGHPSITVDYLQKYNAAILQTPPEQRAWPLYRQALLQMQIINTDYDFLTAHPGDPNFKKLAQWVPDHASAIALIRQASQKPQLGYLLGPAGSGNDPALWPPASRESKYLHSLPPHPRVFQEPFFDAFALPTLAQCVDADAKVAATRGQSARCAEDFLAMFNIADQMQQRGALASDIWAIGVRQYAAHELDRILLHQPMVLSDQDLIRLSRRLSGPKVAADLYSWSFERANFLDVLQRCYTDNGHGNGRITPAGYELLYQNHAPLLPADYLQWPLTLLTGASRRQALKKYEHLLSEIQTNLSMPLREAHWHSYDGELKTLDIRYWNWLVLAAALPSFNIDYDIAERYLGERDGTVVAIALEFYHRQHHAYPATLFELTPDLLPSIPADRITGNPIKFLIRDGHPVLYSVGADKIDNGGIPPHGPQTHPDDAANWNSWAKDTIHGDWILWPPPDPNW